MKARRERRGSKSLAESRVPVSQKPSSRAFTSLSPARPCRFLGSSHRVTAADNDNERESDVTGRRDLFFFSFFFYFFFFFSKTTRRRAKPPFHGLASLASVQRIALPPPSLPSSPKGSSFLSSSLPSFPRYRRLVSFVVINFSVGSSFLQEINNQSIISPFIYLSITFSRLFGMDCCDPVDC